MPGTSITAQSVYYPTIHSSEKDIFITAKTKAMRKPSEYLLNLKKELTTKLEVGGPLMSPEEIQTTEELIKVLTAYQVLTGLGKLNDTLDRIINQTHKR
jgi:hypothetical protein